LGVKKGSDGCDPSTRCFAVAGRFIAEKKTSSKAKDEYLRSGQIDCMGGRVRGEGGEKAKST
jgi:hypothetical protein